MHPASVLLPLVLLPLSLAAQHKVTVGKGGGLNFDPDTLKADKGDTIEFSFYPRNHSVAESTFDKPCQPLDNGIFSGFFGTTEQQKQTFTVTLDNTDPKWLYCSYGNHCQDGMVMVINAPQGKSLGTYKANSVSTQSGSQPKVEGGDVSGQSSGSSSAGTASSTASSASAASGSATSSTAATGTSTGTSTSASTSASTTPNAAGKVGAGAGLGALGLLGVLVGGMV